MSLQTAELRERTEGYPIDNHFDWESELVCDRCGRSVESLDKGTKYRWICEVCFEETALGREVQTATPIL